MRVKPGHDLGKKFANVFKASSASGNIRVIKFRDDGGGARATSRGRRLVYLASTRSL